MCFVPKRCDDMMNVGRLQGFEVNPGNLDHPAKSSKHFLRQLLRPWKPRCNRFLFLICLSSPPCTRGRSQPRANCSSRTPSLLRSRTSASCAESRKDGSSCLSNWSSSASQLTGRKDFHFLDTCLRAASRWTPEKPDWTRINYTGCFNKIKCQKNGLYSQVVVCTKDSNHTHSCLNQNMLHNLTAGTF